MGSLLAALIVGFLTRPRVQFYGFTSVEIKERAGSGSLYKIAFRVRGRSPGSSCLEMRFPSARGRSYEAEFAKWDEAANPVDSKGVFLQWLVPAGYYQPLVPGRLYVVPLIFVAKERQEIFCGWWFGVPDGWFRHRAIDDAATIDVVLTGSGLTWRRKFTPLELRSTGQPRLASPVRFPEQPSRFRGRLRG
jgi:hypothetical protein